MLLSAAPVSETSAVASTSQKSLQALRMLKQAQKHQFPVSQSVSQSISAIVTAISESVSLQQGVLNFLTVSHKLKVQVVQTRNQLLIQQLQQISCFQKLQAKDEKSVLDQKCFRTRVHVNIAKNYQAN